MITQVLGLITAGHHPFSDDYFGQVRLASLVPVPAYDWSFLREIESAPIAWTDALAWRPAIEAWLPVAAGHVACADSLIGLVGTLPAAEQAQTGLPWVAAIVLADADAIAEPAPVAQHLAQGDPVFRRRCRHAGRLAGASRRPCRRRRHQARAYSQ